MSKLVATPLYFSSAHQPKTQSLFPKILSALSLPHDLCQIYFPSGQKETWSHSWSLSSSVTPSVCPKKNSSFSAAAEESENPGPRRLCYTGHYVSNSCNCRSLFIQLLSFVWHKCWVQHVSHFHLRLFESLTVKQTWGGKTQRPVLSNFCNQSGLLAGLINHYYWHVYIFCMFLDIFQAEHTTSKRPRGYLFTCELFNSSLSEKWFFKG